MATGTVVASFVEQGCACLAVRVTEANGDNVEYVARVLIDDAWNAMTTAQKKAALVAAAKAVRDAQVVASPQGLGITGTVTL